MAAAPRSTQDFDDRAELLRARLREARAEADRYEADPTSPEAMARADEVLEVLAGFGDLEPIEVGVGADGSVDVTFWTIGRKVYIEISPVSGRVQAVERDRTKQHPTQFFDELTARDVHALVGRSR